VRELRGMRVRKATTEDFSALYAIGLATPEFQVSSTVAFMEEDEFLQAILSSFGCFMLAETDEGEIIGFVYANQQDPEMVPRMKWACLVYLMVRPEWRKQGVAQALLDSCIADLKNRGTTNLYGWAHAEGNGSMIKFLKKNRFSEGHKYVWMDREL
jgi:GNAT superfamily N-acetyltransferase